MNCFPLNEKLINELSIIHNNEYKYIKKEGNYLYILCSIHGEFKQRLDHHKNGHKCIFCSANLRAQKKALRKEFLLIKANEIHDNKYQYNLTQDTYKAKDKFEVICKDHGSFYTTYDQHLNKKTKCKKCAQLVINKKNTKTNKQFIRQSKNIHLDMYTYDFCRYIKDEEQVIITCKKHGNFSQKATNHLQGKGCPDCAKELNIFTLSSFIKYCNKNNNGLGIFYILKCFKGQEEFYKLRNYF